ncbi:MAG: Pyruvate dehydrogenase, E1 component, beta subunit [Candidatus Beckwithbacteria bacterium GW2011_GWA2_43_10]|uniref:Pyruvate dehydrogenase, E1 component, beta subunit n=1 Tax=Candidatus Beckwithbacteria bacterium GW2011_GWA2_43_10 TaxID=1618369 RepID=A0A0G1BZ35_9BACT|nr:MAG: Pyruvate dehydrogenase, E1 component, beta subunit [Candidatus Beckwithbacteria bacterium GW2011_GWA2_43_10]
MRTLKFKEAIAEALLQTMERDEKVIVLGEGVTDSSGIFGTTLSVASKFPDRVLEMPLSEALITGCGTGMALAGLRPVMVHARNDFLYLAMDQICNHAALWSEMHGGGIKIPWIIRAIVGRGWGNAAQHSQCLHSLFAHIPGLKVVAPSDAKRAKGLLIAAIEDNSPVIFIEHRSLYEREDLVPDSCFPLLPLHEAFLCRQGKSAGVVAHISLIAVSFMVTEALRAAEILEEMGIDSEVVDVSSLKPLDANTICRSVRRTGRAIVLDTGWKSFGVSAEISAIISENCFGDLKKPVVRLALPDAHVPCSPTLERGYYPGVRDIVNTALVLLGRKKMAPKEIGTLAPQFAGPF